MPRTAAAVLASRTSLAASLPAPAPASTTTTTKGNAWIRASCSSCGGEFKFDVDEFGAGAEGERAARARHVGLCAGGVVGAAAATTAAAAAASPPKRVKVKDAAAPTSASASTATPPTTTGGGRGAQGEWTHEGGGEGQG